MMQASTPPLRPTPDRPSGPAVAGARTNASKGSEPLQSSDLFKGQKSVLIEHNGASYRLQTTKLGKLILTK